MVCGTHVGLAPGRAGLPLHEAEFASLAPGGSAGELCLLERPRPPWWSLVVRSASAKVLTIEAGALRDYFAAAGLAAEAAAAAAAADTALYGDVVQAQVAMVEAGGLELSWFAPHMKALMKHVMATGHLERKGAGGGGGGVGAGGSGGAGGGMAAVKYAPIVVESAAQVWRGVTGVAGCDRCGGA
eukprot:66400-Chlamydomonas_euryale.AAC.2